MLQRGHSNMSQPGNSSPSESVHPGKQDGYKNIRPRIVRFRVRVPPQLFWCSRRTFRGQAWSTHCVFFDPKVPPQHSTSAGWSSAAAAPAAAAPAAAAPAAAAPAAPPPPAAVDVGRAFFSPFLSSPPPPPPAAADASSFTVAFRFVLICREQTKERREQDNTESYVFGEGAD
jgi:hypothetical protein